MKLAACIRLTDANENVDNAIASILNLPRGTFQAVFIESPSGRNQVIDSVKQLLANLDFPLHDTGNMEDDIPADCQTVVCIPPGCSFTKVAFDKLIKTMKLDAAAGYRYTHYSMSTVTQLSSFSLWHGFLPMLFFIDWLWASPRFKLPLDRHVRAINVLSMGGRRYLAERHWFWRFWGFDMGDCATLTGGSAAMIETGRNGYSTVRSHVQRHFYLARLWSLGGNLQLGFAYIIMLALVYSLYTLNIHAYVLGGVWIATSFIPYWFTRHELWGASVLPFCTLWPIYLILLPWAVLIMRLF